MHWDALVYWLYMQQLLQGNLLVRDAVPNTAKYSFRHICASLPFHSEGLLVKTRFLWQGRHLPWARLISKWPGCSHCPGLGERFIPVWPILVLSTVAICRLVELPGTWLVSEWVQGPSLSLRTATCQACHLEVVSSCFWQGTFSLELWLALWADEEPKPICSRCPGLVQGRTPEEGAVGALRAAQSNPILCQA